MWVVEILVWSINLRRAGSNAWRCLISPGRPYRERRFDWAPRPVSPRRIEADVAGDWSLKPMDIWHDRAVLHFLTHADDTARYVEHLYQTLKPGGSAIIATFALDGPEMCSGLPVVRYSPNSLRQLFGSNLELIESALPQARRHSAGRPAIVPSTLA